MIKFLGTSDPNTTERLKNAARNSMQYIVDLAANNGWVSGKNKGSLGPYSASDLDAESTRILMRLGEYLLIGEDTLNILEDAKNVLYRLVTNMGADGIVSTGDGSIQLNGSELNHGMLSGPLYVAISGLKQIGLSLPAGIDEKMITDAVQADIARYSNPSVSQSFADIYYNAQLVFLGANIA